jgi:hypothetical protein
LQYIIFITLIYINGNYIFILILIYIMIKFTRRSISCKFIFSNIKETK